MFGYANLQTHITILVLGLAVSLKYSGVNLILNMDSVDSPNGNTLKSESPPPQKKLQQSP